MFVLCIFVVFRLFWGSRADVHALLGTYTAVNTDEFTCVLWLDGQAVDSYSSNGMDSVPRRNWMREGHGHYLWKSVKRLNMKHWNRGRTDILKNDTGLNMSGAAVLQGRFGCEIERNPDSDVRRTRTFAQYGRNGEDFLSFNLSRLQWEASAESAVPMKRKWNRDQGIMKETKNYMEDICVIHLLDSLPFEAEESQKTAEPTAAAFAKRFLNPGKVILTCLVSGFHCRDTTVEVYRDDDITEKDGLLSSGIRPNGDGTCQLRKSLDISNSTEASYSCEVLFGSLKRRVKWDGKIWDRAEPKQDNDPGHYYWWLMVPLFVILGVIYRWCTTYRESLIDASEDSQLEAKIRAPLQETHYESNRDHAESRSEDDSEAEPFSESEGLTSVDGSKDEGGPVAHEGGCHV